MAAAVLARAAGDGSAAEFQAEVAYGDVLRGGAGRFGPAEVDGSELVVVGGGEGCGEGDLGGLGGVVGGDVVKAVAGAVDPDCDQIGAAVGGVVAVDFQSHGVVLAIFQPIGLSVGFGFFVVADVFRCRAFGVGRGGAGAVDVIVVAAGAAPVDDGYMVGIAGIGPGIEHGGRILAQVGVDVHFDGQFGCVYAQAARAGSGVAEVFPHAAIGGAAGGRCRIIGRCVGDGEGEAVAVVGGLAVAVDFGEGEAEGGAQTFGEGAFAGVAHAVGAIRAGAGAAGALVPYGAGGIFPAAAEAYGAGVGGIRLPVGGIGLGGIDGYGAGDIFGFADGWGGEVVEVGGEGDGGGGGVFGRGHGVGFEGRSGADGGAAGDGVDACRIGAGLGQGEGVGAEGEGAGAAGGPDVEAGQGEVMGAGLAVVGTCCEGCCGGQEGEACRQCGEDDECDDDAEQYCAGGRGNGADIPFS